MRDKTRPRKTIELKFVVDKANEILRQSPSDCVQYRRGVITMITDILTEANAYAGFDYLPSELAFPDNFTVATVGVLRDGYDDTRIKFDIRQVGRNA